MRDVDALDLIVVSGLPRSGTSMTMRMLEMGGLPVATDGVRAPDADNPLGYYELEAVKRTRKDAAWLAEANGSAVKVVSFLLRELPPVHHYRVLFMERRLEEVHASQERMLERSGQTHASMSWSDFESLLRRELERTRAWLVAQSNFDVLFVDHHAVLTEAAPQLEAIRRFLRVPLDLDAMERAIQPALYRQRSD